MFERNPLLCYNCFKTGHVSLRCPEPQRRERCSICHRVNQKTDDCPDTQNKPTSSNQKIRKIDENLSSEEKDSLTKTVMINNIELTAFIDPGSSRTLIKESIADNLGTCNETNVLLNGFAGGTFKCEKSVCFKIKIDNQIYDAEALVVEDKLL